MITRSQRTARHIVVHCSLIPGIGAATIECLVRLWGTQGNWTDIYTFSEIDFVRHAGLTPRVAQLLVSGLRDDHAFERECGLIQERSVRICTILDPAYPEQLKTIVGPPPVLYYQGSQIFSDPKLVAVIGSRKADAYGLAVINDIVPALVHNQWVIVSGGALGADTMAHKAALAADGTTIAVIGSGLLRPYPATNKRLFQEIIESGGAVLSPFPLEMEPMPGNFPARNRIISGLSRGVVVVQAAQQSGASITARYALAQGRDVFAVPGPINHELSVGCHRLIQEGACLVAHPDDILQEFGERNVPEKATCIKSATQREPASLADRVLLLLERPMGLEELALTLEQSLEELHIQLFDLQLAGKVTQNFVGMWQRL